MYQVTVTFKFSDICAYNNITYIFNLEIKTESEFYNKIRTKCFNYLYDNFLELDLLDISEIYTLLDTVNIEISQIC